MAPGGMLAAAVALAHFVGAAAWQGLRRSDVAAPRFENLAKCEVAYDKLWKQCAPEKRPAGGQITSKPMYGDEDAPRKGISNGEVGRPDLTEGRPVYHPPESRTGKPNDELGWDYQQHGEDWGRFGECGSKQGQSPVDVSRYVDTQGQTKYLLWFDYYLDPDLQPGAEASLVNDGHGIRFDVRGNRVDLGFVKIGKQEYEAAEYTFHAPSEHTVDGAVFPLELQIYNKAKEGSGIVAIAIFFKEGPSNMFLRELMNATGGKGPVWHMEKGTGTSLVSGRTPNAFNLENVIPHADVSKEASFYNYEGSFTQPPCNPGVDWWVLSTPITATRSEIKFLRKAIFSSESTRHGNARETQPLGDRRIFTGLSGFQHAIKLHKLPQYHHLDESKEPRGYSSQDLPWGSHWGPEDGSEVTF